MGGGRGDGGGCSPWPPDTDMQTGVRHPLFVSGYVDTPPSNIVTGNK